MATLLTALVATATIYNWVTNWAAERWSRLQPAVPSSLPPVSILKPLCGVSPWLYDCLATFCRLDYPAYEVLCCTARADDPASEVVHRLQTDFPHVTLRLFVADRVHGTNAKIDNLDKMYREARHEILVISDDDILVPRDYLQHLVADLETPNVGVVSCPYRGKSGGTAASAFEALGIASEFFSGVFVARWMEGIRFALGSTMAVRKEREIGRAHV